MVRSHRLLFAAGIGFIAVLALLPLTVGRAQAQGFGCKVGFKQEPRVWIYTTTEGAAARLNPVRLSEIMGGILKTLAPTRRQPPYSFEVVRNHATHELLDELDVLSCVSGKRLNVAVDGQKILKFPEAPQSFTLMTFRFLVQDEGKRAEGQPLEVGPYRLLLPNPRDGEALASALTPIVSERLAECLFRENWDCRKGS